MALVVKNPPANAGVVKDLSPIPGLGRYHGVGNSNPFQYSCLENSMGRGAWRTTVHEATMNWTQLSDWTTTNWIAKLQFPLTWDDSYVLGLYILWLLIVVWKIFHLFHSSQSLKLLGMLLNFGKLSLRCLHHRAVGITSLSTLALESDHAPAALSWMETALSFLEKKLALALNAFACLATED